MNMLTNQTQTKNKSRGLFDNPIMKQLGEVKEKSENCVSYKGVALKCVFFIITIVSGVALALLLHMLPLANIISQDGVSFNYAEAVAAAIALGMFIVAPFVAMFAKRTIPVSGAIYCASVGYLYAFIGNLLSAVRGQIFLAMIITVALFFAIMLVYMTGRININKRFSSVLRVLFITMIVSTVLLAVSYFIPGLNVASMFVISNPLISIGLSVVGVVIVSLFLLVDFKTVKDAVDNKLPKKYEWAGAFGIMFSVIWLFIEVLSLISKVQDLG